MAVRSKSNQRQVQRDSSCDCRSGALREMKALRRSSQAARSWRN